MQVNCKLPAVSLQFYSNEDIAQMIQDMNERSEPIKSTIAYASDLTNVPVQLIKSIIYEESRFDESIVSSVGATGYMQLKPQTANDIIFLENKKDRLSYSEQAEIVKRIGQKRFDTITSMKFLGQKSCQITEQDLYNGFFNILCGSMLIGLLIDECTDKDSILSIDSALLRYAKGYFYKPIGDSILERLSKLNKSSEAYLYVLKIVGINGILTKQIT